MTMIPRTRSALYRAGLGTLIASCATPLLADATSYSLDELVVVGNRAPAQISQVPGTVWVLEQEALETQFKSGQDLKSVLGKLVPGLDLAPQGRTNFGQNMRGRSVLVMIDGVSLNSSRGLSRQFDSIDPFNIERIEVLSGATAIYGGGSTGGIINIITHKGEAGDTRYRTEASASSGFNDSEDRVFRAGQSISGGNDRVQGRLAVATQRNSAFYDADGDAIMPDITQTDLQYNRSLDVMGSVRLQLDDLQSLELLGQAYDSRFNGNQGVYLGPNLSTIADPEIRTGYKTDRAPETDRHLVNLNYQHRDLFGHTAYLQLSTRGEKASFHPYPYIRQNMAQSYVGASLQDTTQHNLKGLLVKHWGDWQFSYGVDMDREDFKANQMIFDTAQALQSGAMVTEEDFTVGRYPGYRVDGVTAFLQTEWQATERLRLNAGIRQRHSSLEVDDFVPTQQQIDVQRGLATGADAIPGGENSYDVTLVNAGAIYNLTASQQLWTSFSQGFEIPDPGKVFGRGSYSLDNGYYTLNDALDVDSNTLPGLKTHQVELGWRAYEASWEAQVAAYYTWSDKDTRVTDTLQIDVVDAKTRDYGLEASLAYRISDQWRAGAQGHVLRSEVKNEGDWDKKDARYASLPSAMAFVEWQDARTQVRLQGNHAFDIDDDAGNEIDGFTTVDLQASRELPVGRLGMGISNLLNNDYLTVWGQRAQMFYGYDKLFEFQGRGRTYTLSYTVDY